MNVLTRGNKASRQDDYSLLQKYTTKTRGHTMTHYKLTLNNEIRDSQRVLIARIRTYNIPYFRYMHFYAEHQFDQKIFFTKKPLLYHNSGVHHGIRRIIPSVTDDLEFF